MIFASVDRAMREHALQEYPREACGLVAVVRGKQRYLPCRNIAAENCNFVMHPEDYAAASELGELIAVFHSHPNASPQMSQADIAVCEQEGNLPWFVVSVGDAGNTGQMVRYDPCGYVVPLVNREFSHGVLDCYQLLKDYYQRELNITLPHYEREDKWWHNGQDLYMQQFRDAGFVEVPRADIRLHDIILMQIRAPVVNHAGVYIGDGLLLHHQYHRLSTRDVYDGYYQETTRAIVRHKDLM